MPKPEIYRGIAPATEKGFESFGRTDCVTDLNQPRDASLHRTGAFILYGRWQSQGWFSTTERMHWSSVAESLAKAFHWASTGEMLSRAATCFVTRGWCGTHSVSCASHIQERPSVPRSLSRRCSPWKASCKPLDLHTVFPPSSPSRIGIGVNFPSAGFQFFWRFTGWAENGFARTKTETPRARYCRAWCATSSCCSLMSPLDLAASQDTGGAGKSLSLGCGAIWDVEGRTAFLQGNPSLLLPPESCCWVSNASQS